MTVTQPMPPQQSAGQLPVVLGDPVPVEFQVGCTPPDAAGKSYPVLLARTGGTTIEMRMTEATARTVAANLAPALTAMADLAARQSIGIVVPPPGFILPTPRQNGSST